MDYKITKNSFNIPQENLFTVGNRANNPKRSFLFISKILGKHIEVNPKVCKISGALLSSFINKKIDFTEQLVKSISNPSLKNMDIMSEIANIKEGDFSKTLVIGFAETATALGMSVSATLPHSYYQTTTRENIKDAINLFSFQEEHSHATTHKCYNNPNDKINFNQFERIVLVDDEITTGHSMLNIISELIKVSKIRKFDILTLLDWRNEEFLEKYEMFNSKNKTDIHVYTLIKGEIINEENNWIDKNHESEIKESVPIHNMKRFFPRANYTNEFEIQTYNALTGRFGIKQEQILSIEDIAQKCADRIVTEAQLLNHNKKRILVLGHGEDMYIPSRIADFISTKLNDKSSDYIDVQFKSTTRSPISVDGKTIFSRHYFMNKGVKYYFYNKQKIEEEFDICIIISEDAIDKKLTDNIFCVAI